MKQKRNIKLLIVFDLCYCHNSKLSFVNCRVCTLFWAKNSRLFKDFQGHIFHFSRTPFSAKKSLESTCFLVLPQNEQFYPEGLSVFTPFSLEFYVHYKVSIEIQGLSSSDCNFQGLSRPQIFILKFKDFKGLLRCVWTL